MIITYLHFHEKFYYWLGFSTYIYGLVGWLTDWLVKIQQDAQEMEEEKLKIIIQK